MDDLKRAVVGRIKQVRDDAGFSNLDIVDRSNGVLSKNKVSLILSGRQRLTTEDIEGFAAAFGVSAQYLMFGTGGETHLVNARDAAERDLIEAARRGDMIAGAEILAAICRRNRKA